MNKKTFKRIGIIAAITGILLVVATVLGLRFATQALKIQVEQALGPESEVGELTVGWSAIEIHRVRIRAPRDWPAEDALRARRVVIRPDLLGLFSARAHVPRITIEQAYLSVLRTRDGRLRLLPGLLEKAAQEAKSGTPPSTVSIGTIELREGALEFFDASVRQPAHKIRLEQLQANVDGLKVPSLAGRTELQLAGIVKGVQHDGSFSINGWMEIADKSSEITTRLQGVDLVTLQPYLIKASETGVRRGTLDLQLKSTVRRNHLHAPGTITLAGLELASGGGMVGTFMGVPRQAVVATLQNRNGRITIQFTLDGNLNDPQFSLNENMAMRVGTAVAETLGISIEGLTRGIGGATEGIGDTVKKLFGK